MLIKSRIGRGGGGGGDAQFFFSFTYFSQYFTMLMLYSSIEAMLNSWNPVIRTFTLAHHAFCVVEHLKWNEMKISVMYLSFHSTNNNPNVLEPVILLLLLNIHASSLQLMWCVLRVCAHTHRWCVMFKVTTNAKYFKLYHKIVLLTVLKKL